jgi:hypothetical protein
VVTGLAMASTGQSHPSSEIPGVGWLSLLL